MFGALILVSLWTMGIQEGHIMHKVDNNDPHTMTQLQLRCLHNNIQLLKDSLLENKQQFKVNNQVLHGAINQTDRQVHQVGVKTNQCNNGIANLERQMNVVRSEVAQCSTNHAETERQLNRLENKMDQMTSLLQNIQSKVDIIAVDCIDDMEPVGVTYGTHFSDKQLHLRGQISKVTVRHGRDVDCLGLTYGTVDGPCHGGNGGDLETINLQSGEYITGITGRVFEGFKVLAQITIVTNQRTLGTYGETHHAPFSRRSNDKRLAYISGTADNSRLRQLILHFYC